MISYIVPVFNAEGTIERCINSILKQTYVDIELILVDDGSVDSSGEICTRYAACDARVKYYYKENGGAASARNLGMQIASGEWVQFVDADDYVQNTMTEKLINSACNHKTDWVISSMKYITLRREWSNTFGNQVCRTKEEMHDVICSNFTKVILHSCCNKLYKRCLITDNMRTDHVYGEDYIFNLRYLQNITSFSVIDEPLYIYDCTRESVTRGKSVNRADIIIEQYELSCKLLVDYFQSEELFSIVTEHFAYDLLTNYTANMRCHNINAEAVKSILQRYEQQMQRIDADGIFSEALRSLNYIRLAQILRKKRCKAVIRNRIKQIIRVFHK